MHRHPAPSTRFRMTMPTLTQPNSGTEVPAEGSTAGKEEEDVGGDAEGGVGVVVKVVDPCVASIATRKGTWRITVRNGRVGPPQSLIYRPWRPSKQ